MGTGERLKEFRAREGVSQQTIATRFGVSRAAVAQWEAGTTRPDQGKLVELAEMLHVNLAELLAGEEEQEGHKLEPGDQHELDIVAIRRKRLRQVIDDRFGGKQTRFVEATGINAGELSGLMRDKPFGGKKARTLEEKVGLPRGYLDGELEDHVELLEAWGYLQPAEKEAIMEQIRPMAAHNKAVLKHYSKP